MMPDQLEALKKDLAQRRKRKGKAYSSTSKRVKHAKLKSIEASEPAFAATEAADKKAIDRNKKLLQT